VSENINVRPVRTVIAGCGGVTVDILEVIRDFPEFEFLAVQDISPDAVSKIGWRFNITATYTEFSDLLQPDVEFVIINTPNHMHHPQAIQALNAGKHCTVQKPIARNTVEAREMIDVASKAGKLLGVTMEERGNVVYRQMKSMIESGCIGEVVAVQAMMAHTRHLKNPFPKEDWRASPEQIGGGSFIQLAIHHIDIAQWLIGDEIVEVSAQSSSMMCKETFPSDETTVSAVRFSRGATGSFASSFACDADMFFVYGSEGYIGRRGNRISWEVNQPYKGRAWSCEKAGEPGNVVFDWYSSRPMRTKREYEQHRQFALAIREQTTLDATAKIGLKDLQIVEAIHKSSREGRSIKIQPSEIV
jgi:predicted dehydrogenase